MSFVHPGFDLTRPVSWCVGAQVLPQLQAVDEIKHLSEAKPSFARVRYSEQCEAAINEQINVEYTISVRASVRVSMVIVFSSVVTHTRAGSHRD